MKCSNCGAPPPEGATSCPYCDTQFPAPKPKARRKIHGVGLQLGVVEDADVTGTGIQIKRAIRCRIRGVGIQVRSACPETTVTGTGCQVLKVES